MTTAYLCWTTGNGFKMTDLGFWTTVERVKTHTDVAENDSIVCLDIFNNSCHISVCKFDIRCANTIDICS